MRLAFEQSRAAWPEVALPEEAFASYVAARAEGADMNGLHGADLYLACACASGNPRAIALFDRVHLSAASAIMERAGIPRHLAVDAAQLLRVHLLTSEDGSPPGITGYGGRGSLAGWVRIVALRAASKLRRGERARAEPPDVSVAVPASPEDTAIRARYGDAFNQAFRDALHALPAEDRLILRLHFAEGMNLEKLAAAFGFSRATAGRRILAARDRMREETLRLVGERLNANREELESVLRALRSHLDVSFGTLVSAA